MLTFVAPASVRANAGNDHQEPGHAAVLIPYAKLAYPQSRDVVHDLIGLGSRHSFVDERRLYSPELAISLE